MRVIDVIVTLEYGIMYQFKLDEPDYHRLERCFRCERPVTLIIKDKNSGRKVQFSVASIISLSTYSFHSLREFATHKIVEQGEFSARYADRVQDE